MYFPGTEAHRGTFVHRASPRWKLALALAIITGTALLPRRPDALYLVPGLVLSLLWLITRMPLRYALRRLLLAQAFILGIAGLSLLSPSALPSFAATVLKSNLCVFTLFLLTWTTPFYQILQVLRQLRVPSVMLTTLALMYRYLPVLGEEARRMERARSSRTFSSQRTLVWQNLSTIIGRLFVRTTDRAERIFLAMCARGWK